MPYTGINQEISNLYSTTVFGQTSDTVRQLQQKLISAGYAIPAGATGYYGDQTEVALNQWKSKLQPQQPTQQTPQAQQVQQQIESLKQQAIPLIQEKISGLQKQVQEQQAQAQAIASGQVKNIGTPEAPLTVPLGTPTPQESNQAFQAQQPAPVYQQTPQQPAQPAQQQGQQQTYQVRPGTNLTIAAREMGINLQQLLDANPEYKANPNFVRAGAILKYPQIGQQGGFTGQTGQITTPPQTTPTGASGASGEGAGGGVGGGIAPTTAPIDFIATYTKSLSDLGIPTIKVEFEKIQKQYTDLQNELNSELSEVEENPFYSEKLRADMRNKKKSEYEGRIGILTNQMQLYDNLYKEGVAQAQYLATGQTNYQQQAFENSLAKAEAEAKIWDIYNQDKKNYSNYKEVQGGLWDLDENRWIIPPKAEAEGAGKDEVITSQSQYQINANQRILQSIDELLPRVNGSIVGPAGLTMSFIPGTDAYNFKAELQTLKSNITFGALTAMREASKTGGALGQVSDAENKLLGATLGALDMGQSPTNFMAQLQKIRDSINRWNNAAMGNMPASQQSGGNNDPFGVR